VGVGGVEQLAVDGLEAEVEGVGQDAAEVVGADLAVGLAAEVEEVAERGAGDLRVVVGDELLDVGQRALTPSRLSLLPFGRATPELSPARMSVAISWPASSEVSFSAAS
jgi:hypothetical protein